MNDLKSRRIKANIGSDRLEVSGSPEDLDKVEELLRGNLDIDVETKKVRDGWPYG